MEIRFPVNYSYNIQVKPHSTNKQESEGKSYSPISSVCPAYFSPSFMAMKEKDFVGTDRYVVEKYKAPVSSFNSHKDFDAWAKEKCEEIKNKDYKGRNEETAKKRKEMVKQWKSTLSDSLYTPAQTLLVMDSITKPLGENGYTLPPECNENILRQSLFTVINEIEENPNKKECDFNRIYQKNLKAFNRARKDMSYEELNRPSIGANMTGWVKIPSKENEPERFGDNLIKFATLYGRWCSKSTNDLLEEDQHFYLENGVPKFQFSFYEDELCGYSKIGGGGNIPFRYYDECCRYINENNFKVSDSIEEQLEHRKKTIEKYTPLIKELKEMSPEEIFKTLDIETEKDENGMLSISHFDRSEKMKKDGVTFEDLEINLEELLKNVKEIKGNADFSNLTIKEIPNLELIGGDANFFQAKIDKMNKLREVKKEGDFRGAKINDLSGLERIGGYTRLNRSIIGNMSNFREYGDNIDLQYAEIEDLSGLKTIKRCSFHCTKIGNLSGLETIEENASFSFSEIGDLSGLKTIGGEAWFMGAKIGNMDGLEKIGSNAIFCDSEIPQLPNLTEIGGSADFKNAKIGNLEELLERFKEKIKS